MSETPFVPISPNPYIVGNPVRGRSMFFGREAEFNLVRKRFEHSEQGGLLVFCGERRSGKTSILFQILDHRLGPDFIPVLIDMQSMAVGSEAEFLTRLSEEILAAFGESAAGIALPDFAHDLTNRTLAFHRFVQECLRKHPGRKLILLFDEYELFENKIESGLLADEVLYILAGLMEHASVFMIFTGSQHLEQRRAEYWKILGKSLYKTVSYLEREDAVSLIRQPVAGRVTFDDPSVAAILRLAAGQPFYTQAICQSLVDHLNDLASREATPERVAEVVDGIVNNPLPQMIFLWDGLDRDDKLVMSLLAECIEDGETHAGVDALLKHVRKRDYPLEMEVGRVATTLEKLYKSEMLLRDDRGTAPAYAFRMDLWRLWIRRQHSLWQVMREEKLEIKGSPRRRRMIALAATLLVAVVAVAGFAAIMRRRGPEATVLGPNTARGYLMLEADPDNAAIRMDGARVGLGAVRDSVAAGVPHRIELSAPGYADTTLSGQVAEGDTLAMRVALRALRGDLVVQTTPPGADVSVDGRAAGKSPVTLRGLPVAGTHRVEALRAGFGVARTEVTLTAGQTVTAALTLEQGKVDVMVTSEPSGADIRLDGAARGAAPSSLAGLALGRHTLRATREGYNPAESTLVVTAETRQIHFALEREAPGTLVVLGDLPAQIYVDGTLVVENVQNSGPRRLPPGAHTVRVILVSGQTVDHTVTVRSGERAVYDFSKNTVAYRPDGGR